MKHENISALFIKVASFGDLALLNSVLSVHDDHKLTPDERPLFWDALFDAARANSALLDIDSKKNIDEIYKQITNAAGSPLSAYSDVLYFNRRVKTLHIPHGALFDIDSFWAQKLSEKSPRPLFHELCTKLIQDENLPKAAASIYKNFHVHIAAFLLSFGRLDDFKKLYKNTPNFDVNLLTLDLKTIDADYTENTETCASDLKYLHQFAVDVECVKTLKEFGCEFDYSKLKSITDPNQSSHSYQDFLLNSQHHHLEYDPNKTNKVEVITEMLSAAGALDLDAQKFIIADHAIAHSRDKSLNFMDCIKLLSSDEWCTPFDKSKYNNNAIPIDRLFKQSIQRSQLPDDFVPEIIKFLSPSWLRTMKQGEDEPFLVSILTNLWTLLPDVTSENWNTFLNSFQAEHPDKTTFHSFIQNSSHLSSLLLKIDQGLSAKIKTNQHRESTFNTQRHVYLPFIDCVIKNQPEILFYTTKGHTTSPFDTLFLNREPETALPRILLEKIPFDVFLKAPESSRINLLTYLFSHKDMFNIDDSASLIIFAQNLCKITPFPKHLDLQKELTAREFFGDTRNDFERAVLIQGQMHPSTKTKKANAL